MRVIIILFILINFLYAQDKIALLIGNSDYSFAPLDNPLHDVDGLYQTLREIGFKKSNIKILKNSSQNEMKKALFDFEQKASSSNIALIYFSGHGMQVNNTNYMFPANTTATKPIHLEGLVNLNFFIQSATSARYGIVLVDACRNNPLIKYFQNGKHKGSNAKKGLGQVTPTVGQVVIGFATSAGDTADDGNGDMSPYATSLTKWLKKPDDIRNILGKVAIDVSKKYEQNPIYRANLAESVYLGGEVERVETPEITTSYKQKFEFNYKALWLILIFIFIVFIVYFRKNISDFQFSIWYFTIRVDWYVLFFLLIILGLIFIEGTEYYLFLFISWLFVILLTIYEISVKTYVYQFNIEIIFWFFLGLIHLCVFLMLGHNVDSYSFLWYLGGLVIFGLLLFITRARYIILPILLFVLSMNIMDNNSLLHDTYQKYAKLIKK